MKIFFLLIAMLIISSCASNSGYRIYSESGKGKNGFYSVHHEHQDNNYCRIVQRDSGYSKDIDCTFPIVKNSVEDQVLFNYAKSQIDAGVTKGNKISDSGLMKVKWEVRENKEISIISWLIENDEPFVY